jgi:hypothetical protein
MGAVADFVEDTFDFVGDVFEAVGDAVEDVVEFVGDAVEKVGDVVQAVLDDPLPVLLAVAGASFGIPPYITSGVVTAARGGDLEDIALSMGTSYLGSSAGAGITNSISSTVSSTFIEAGVNETFAEIASDSITKGLVNGTIAEVRGGDFEDGFAGGFTGGLVAGGVGEVASYVKPDIVEFAMDSGFDLRDANSLFNAGVRAVTAGVTSEVTGRGDFATSFTNSAIGSGVDYGMREVNKTIDEQFNTAATGWNETSNDDKKVDTTVVGAGIPNDLVTEVKISDIGVDNDAGTFDVASVFAEPQDTSNVNNTSSSYTGETATSNISVLPETQLAEAPKAETIYDFADTTVAETPVSSDSVLAEATNLPESVINIADSLPEDTSPDVSTEPVGGLNVLAETTPIVDLDTTTPAVVSEAPIAQDLLSNNLTQDKTEEQPTGGLNAVASQTAVDKMSPSLNLKPTDFTKPVVATVGNLIKQTLTQPKRPTNRPTRPAGGLQLASPKLMTKKPVTPPPPRMDVAKLIPIQKAPFVGKPLKASPPKTLAGNANLTPVSNIAGLTSLVKKTG